MALRNGRPSRSPDLTSPDFFLWRYLKEKVYIPVDRDKLIAHIQEIYTGITPQMLPNV